MPKGEGLNRAACQIFTEAENRATELRLRSLRYSGGARVLDFGIGCEGGLEAGVHLASICMAGQARVNLTSGDRAIWPGAWVQVATDHPLEACMLAQYAGWPVKHDSFFAMGSGSMRIARGREELLLSLTASDASPVLVGTLECDQLPDNAVVESMAAECNVRSEQLCLAVAPTRSIAGGVQVVARSIETCLHKLHELGFDLNCVRSGYGLAPLPPPTPDFALGIGRTNDAILYGATVSLWLDADDAELVELGKQLPSCASPDFGAPFAEVFKRCDYDFYKIDPGLFSPAEVTLMNSRTGNSLRFGGLRGDLIARSFGTRVAS